MQIQDYLRAPDQERHVCAPHVVACHVDDDAALLQLIQNAMAPVAKGGCQASTCTEDFGAPDLQLQLHGLWQLWGQPTVNHIQPTTSHFRGRMAEGHSSSPFYSVQAVGSLTICGRNGYHLLLASTAP